MTRPLLFALPGNERFEASLTEALGGETGTLTVRRFPDGESYVRFDTPVVGRDVILVCTLDRPDEKLLPLVFAAGTAADLGAMRVGLISPYLAYMRQDRRFQPGEAVTSTHFARVLSGAVDWIVTVDPHLHRRTSLSEIYTVPTSVVHAASLLAKWIHAHIDRPLLIGPDVESEQWVRAVAVEAGAPHIVLEKVRRGDRDVVVSIPQIERWRAHTPVLVDDIISTARTMIETVQHLLRAAMAPPICIGVHGIFAEGAYEALLQSGVSRVITANTVLHPTNGIDLGKAVAEGARSFVAGELAQCPGHA